MQESDFEMIATSLLWVQKSRNFGDFHGKNIVSKAVGQPQQIWLNKIIFWSGFTINIFCPKDYSISILIH